MNAGIDPSALIVPLLGMRNGTPAAFLGTASVIGPQGLLLTADHVIADWDHDFGIVTMGDLNRVHQAQILERDQPHDLALLRTPTYGPADHLVPAFGKSIFRDVTVTSL